MKRRQLLQRAATGLALVAGPQVIDMGSSSGSSQDATSPLNELLSVVSLSHVNDPATTPVFPGDPEFTLDTAATIADDGYYLQYVKEGEHTGTHWGAPAHFQEGGLTADQLDPADLFLPAVKIDIRDKAAADSDYALTVADLQEWETRNGKIPDGAAVVLWTGWESRWGSEEYANSDAEDVTHQPGFSVDAARWLIDTGRLGTRGALGTDTFGPRPRKRRNLPRLDNPVRQASNQPGELEQSCRPANHRGQHPCRWCDQQGRIGFTGNDFRTTTAITICGGRRRQRQRPSHFSSPRTSPHRLGGEERVHSAARRLTRTARHQRSHPPTPMCLQSDRT